MPENPNTPTDPGRPTPPVNPPAPANARPYLAALYSADYPLRPIDLYEYATGETVPTGERGAKGRAVAAELKALIKTGDVVAVWSEHFKDGAVRYSLTASGRNTGRDEAATRPPRGTKPGRNRRP